MRDCSDVVWLLLVLVVELLHDRIEKEKSEVEERKGALRFVLPSVNSGTGSSDGECTTQVV